MTEYKKPLILDPKGGKAQACVMLIHGLGASGHDFEGFIPALQSQLTQPVRFVLPHAPEMAVTVNQGGRIPAWYDIANPDLSRDHDEAGILKSTQYLHQLIEQQIQTGLPAHKILIAGFSQGGVMSLSSALSYPQALAGCLVISSYLADTPALIAPFRSANAKIPLSWIHGHYDSIVPLHNAERSVERLKELGYTLALKSYPVAHTISPFAIGDIVRFFNTCFSQPVGGSA